MLFLLFSLNTYIKSDYSYKIDSSEIRFYNTILKIKSNLEEKDKIAYHYWDSIPILSPIKTKNISRISSDYGMRKHPCYKIYKMHYGIDLCSSIGTSILSTANGKVEFIKKSNRGYGNQIIINHGNNYKTRYAHLGDIFVEKGQEIKKGETIGTLGVSGLTTGPHLHYEILKNNKAIDPMFFTYKNIKDRNEDLYLSTLIALEST